MGCSGRFREGAARPSLGSVGPTLSSGPRGFHAAPRPHDPRRHRPPGRRDGHRPRPGGRGNAAVAGVDALHPARRAQGAVRPRPEPERSRADQLRFLRVHRDRLPDLGVEDADQRRRLPEGRQHASPTQSTSSRGTPRASAARARLGGSASSITCAPTARRISQSVCASSTTRTNSGGAPARQ